MRSAVAVVLLSGAIACAHGSRQAVAVSDDGRAAIVGGQAWRAPEGVTFFERDGALHVVSLVPGTVFDVAIPLGPDGRPSVPESAPFELRDGVVLLRDRPLPPTAQLVDTGQLYSHDDHFHLTHRWENPDWRALYRDRQEDSDLPAGTRQVAAFALATLLDQRLPGDGEEVTARALRRMEQTVSRARRAVEGRYPAKQIMAMLLHDFEILEDGTALAIEGRIFKAGDGVKFSYCGDHFHVDDAGGGWSQPIPLAGAEPGQFEMPGSMFFEVTGGTVAPRAGDLAWKALLAGGQIHLDGDRWVVTEQYALPAFARLQRASRDESAPRPAREAARRRVIEVLRLPLDVESDAAFRTRLAAIDDAIEARWRELEAQLAGKRR